jgi:hypothetical protein
VLTGWSDKIPGHGGQYAHDDGVGQRRHHLRGPLRALGARQLARDRDRFQARPRGLARPPHRRAALWLYALFFHGEDSVTDNLSPYIDAAPREEQKYFLATQQADEARHSVFFKRFLHEVVGRATAPSRAASRRRGRS